MKTVRAAMCIALLGGVIGNGVVADARVRAPSCLDGQMWAWCGDHVPRARLPLTFRIQTSSAPANVTRFGAADALAEAAATWSAAWPGVARCDAICSGGATSSAFGRDGQNTISWDDPARCRPGSAGAVAVACVFYESAGSPHISEVDIILNAAVPWRQAGAGENVAGEVYGAVPTPGGPGWYDVQSVLTHELGHALGLEDIGNTSAAFAADAFDAPRYTQTMYRWYFKGSTNKRTLESGDQAGVAYLWSMSHEH